MLKPSILVSLLLCSVLLLSACKSQPSPPIAGDGESPTGATETVKINRLEQIKKNGKITVGTSADYPPYEFHREVDKKDTIVGFDIAIAEEIAKELGVTLELKEMKFEGLLAALEAGSIDFAISGMEPTEERKKNADFTKIYYKAIQTVSIRDEDKEKYKTIEDLKGKKVGAQKGTIQETIVKEQLPQSELKAMGKISDLILELKTKKVDALILEKPVATSYMKNKDFVFADVKLTAEDAGSAIAVRKNSPELVEAMNKTIDKLLADKSIYRFVAEANEWVEQK
ncbi:transporter substrate-binding domain-containing protein [Paenibacillus filicis]|uniref:Transporter substrate-binding domain-containing protein n=1 Tax=Paenibacillus filicis TaxID=669464 RepID=A0ABU9DHW8_9BACL